MGRAFWGLMVFAMTILPLAGYAQSFGTQFESVAEATSYRVPQINPAALAFGSGRGFGYARGFDDEEIREDFDLFFNLSNFAYQYQGYADETYHSLSLSLPLFRNFYFGSTLTTTGWVFSDSAYTLGFLYRPTDLLSFGARNFFPREGDARHRVGIGVRPFAVGRARTGIPPRALTLSADVPIVEEELQSPVLRATSEAVEGLELSFAYDMESEGFSFEASLAIEHVKSGAAAITSSDAEITDGRASFRISPKAFNRFKEPGTDLIYDYSQSAPMVESPSATRFGNFYMLANENSVYQVTKRIAELADDPLVSGIIFINEHPAASYAHVIELKRALLDFKAKGKRVIFFSQTMSTPDYLLAASTADKIYLSPAGMIDLKGISISSPYLGSFLEKWGIEVRNFRSSNYKSSYDFLSEPGMREAEREMLESVTNDLLDSIKTLIAEGRGDTLDASIADIIDDGPYLDAERALSRGLVDELIYEDQLEEKIPFYENPRIRRDFAVSTVRRDWSDPKTGSIAVINAIGSIHSGRGVPGQSIGAETIIRSLRAARENSSVDAILLRVDSGGGSVIASDAIAREVALCSEGDEAKPIVVSMGSTAASGGYYIAAHADRIIAYSTTLTGSIGVVAPVPGIEQLLEKQMISWDVVKTSESADFGSIYRPFTEEEEEKMRSYIDTAYDNFVRTVAEGREMEIEEVEEYARGRVWTGRQAEERGLVDSLGGIPAAIEALTELADLPKEIELVDYSYADTWGIFPIKTLGLESFVRAKGFLTRLDGVEASGAVLSGSLPVGLRRMAEYLQYAEAGEKRLPLYMMPYHAPGFVGE